MTRRMLIDARHPEEIRLVIADDDHIQDFDYITASKKQVKGNVYLAKVTRVEPSLQAAFVEYGGNKQGFLPFAEIHPDYYQIPVADRQKLIAEEEAEAAELAQQEDEAAEAAEKEARRPRRRRRVAKAAVEDESIQSEPVDEEVHDEPVVELEEDEEHEAETVSIDDAAPEPRRERRGSYRKRYKIQEVIKRGQIVLVQVIKEERGNKGVSLTTYMSLAGRYCVLMPNSPKDGGISRKIASGSDRKRLKEIAAELREMNQMSAIIRTAGTDRTRAEIKRDYDYLLKLWNQIREDTLQSTAPALVYEEGDVIKRALRDLYTNDIEEVLVDGEPSYKDAKAFMKMLMPSHAARVKRYKEELPIFYAYDIEEQLATMFEPEAALPSGGSIVIHPTEALISIDVNSGRSTTERNIEETALRTNLEAAQEVARQLRLRDLAGLIVIDFIDMFYGRNRRQLEREMRSALKQDRAKIQMGRISAFGLMELSRQRMRPSISEASNIPCPHCKGTGFLRSNDTLAIQLIRIIGKEAVSGDYPEFRVHVNPEAALHLLNHKRHLIREIEDEYNVKILVMIDSALLGNDYRLIKVNKDGNEVSHEESSMRSRAKRRGRGGRGRRGGRGGGRRYEEESDNSREESRPDTITEEEDNQPEEKRGGRNRGRRRDGGQRHQHADERKSVEKTQPPQKEDGVDHSSSAPEEAEKPQRNRTTARSQATANRSTPTEDKAAVSAPAEDSDEKPKRTRRTSRNRKRSEGGSRETTNDNEAEHSGPKKSGWWNRA